MRRFSLPSPGFGSDCRPYQLISVERTTRPGVSNIRPPSLEFLPLLCSFIAESWWASFGGTECGLAITFRGHASWGSIGGEDRADAPQMTALGAASGSFRMLGPVSLQQVLEVVAEFDDSGGASLGLVAWELCVDEELVAPAWQQAITDGLIRPAGRDWQEQLWRLSSAGWAAARSERRRS
jgi:hypothetical protein